MLFNPDLSKSAQEGIFSREKQIQIHPIILIILKLKEFLNKNNFV